MADDFDKFLDDALEAAREGADALKKFIGPFGSLLNPQSSQRDKQDITELRARIARQERQNDTLLDTIAMTKEKLLAAEHERDSLRQQVNKQSRRTTMEKTDE